MHGVILLTDVTSHVKILHFFFNYYQFYLGYFFDTAAENISEKTFLVKCLNCGQDLHVVREKKGSKYT